MTFMTSSLANKFSAMGKLKKMHEKLLSTKQILLLYNLVRANSVIHVRKFPRKEVVYMTIMFSALILTNITICF